jgi:hypothetical protein
MKKLRLLMFVALLAVPQILWPFTADGEHGAFNTISGLVWCETRSDCVHEMGHALDQKAGWISGSPEFGRAVELYLVVELQKNEAAELPVLILNFTYRGSDPQGLMKQELYAYLFQRADGQPEGMPADFVRFYDWTEAARLLLLIDRGPLLFTR